MRRVKSYLRRLFVGVFVLLALIGILVLAQFAFGVLDGPIAYLDQDLAAFDRTLTREAVAGVSFGALALVLVVAALPLLSRGVGKRQYLGSLFRGILASGIFLASDRFYSFMEGYGRFYLTAAVLAAAVLTVILVEVAVRMGKAEEEKAARTDIIASIVGGLAFALILRLGSYGLEQLGALVG
ncbi:MAG TPA: hypothetical protein PKW82_08270 [Spirochaetales bacterium]|nr:hypothetical protein [Spirochaetales bacterium]